MCIVLCCVKSIQNVHIPLNAVLDGDEEQLAALPPFKCRLHTLASCQLYQMNTEYLGMDLLCQK